jgi:hypothetical protein
MVSSSRVPGGGSALAAGAVEGEACADGDAGVVGQGGGRGGSAAADAPVAGASAALATLEDPAADADTRGAPAGTIPGGAGAGVGLDAHAAQASSPTRARRARM